VRETSVQLVYVGEAQYRTFSSVGWTSNSSGSPSPVMSPTALGSVLGGAATLVLVIVHEQGVAAVEPRRYSVPGAPDVVERTTPNGVRGSVPNGARPTTRLSVGSPHKQSWYVDEVSGVGKMR